METTENAELLRSRSNDCVVNTSQRPVRNLSFGVALQYLQEGMNVRRAIWKGYWFLAQDPYCQAPSPAGAGYVRGFSFKNGLIVAVLANNGGCAPAQPYQADLLATDWEIAFDA